MNDRELLELAAKAAGYKWSEAVAEKREALGLIGLWLVRDDGELGTTNWNPLTDDGQALRLAVKLRLSIFMNWSTVFVGREDSEENPIAFIDSGEQERDLQSVRETIVRAAAEIGRSMP